jgi:EmrB/QacA subfamily drug resistance transporter
VSVAEPAPAASAGLEPASTGARAGRGTHKGLALAVLAMAQLMVVLDATIVNVALNRIREALAFSSESDLQWIVTGYALTFGGFLLLGGKLADRLGRRRVFMGGAVLFAVASFLGGIAENQTLLIAARALQGLGGAFMSPAALSLLTVVFPEGRERDRALGIWAAITAGGAALGLVLGGVLTEYLSWRWVFFVNVPVAVLAVVGALRFVPESRDEDARGFDVTGAVLATGGLMSLVYGLAKVNDDGYGTALKAFFFVLAAALLAAFVAWQRTTKEPLLPFRVFRSRSVVGADTGVLLVGAGIFAVFFFLTLWMQILNGWSPIRTGIAFLPFPFVIGIGAAISSNLLGRVGPRPLVLVGPLIAASGLLHLGLRLEPGSGYWSVVIPSFVLVALGMGLSFVAVTSAAVAGVPPQDAGVASALLNSGQQVGGAIGLALLTAVSTARTDSLLARLGADGGTGSDGFGGGAVLPPPVADAINEGWNLGFLVGAALLTAAAVLMFSLVRVDRADAARALKEGAAAAA